MRSTREIEERIRKLQEVEKIIVSMKSIASLNIQGSHNLIDSLRDYEKEVSRTIGMVLSYFPEVVLSFKGGYKLIVVFGSDQGLCGLFNERIASTLRGFGDDLIGLILVGKKLTDIVEDKVIKVLSAPISYDSIYAHASELVDLISSLYTEGKIGEILLAYNRFAGIGSYTPTVRRIIPFEVKREEVFGFPPLTDVSPEEILMGLIVEYLYSNLYRAFLESFLSENGVRLTNMDNAFKSLEKGIAQLEIEKNYFRQEEITTEIEEILTAYKQLAEES